MMAANTATVSSATVGVLNTLANTNPNVLIPRIDQLDLLRLRSNGFISVGVNGTAVAAPWLLLLS